MKLGSGVEHNDSGRSLQENQTRPDIVFTDPNVPDGYDNSTIVQDPNKPDHNYFIPDPEIFFCDFSASFVLRFTLSDYLLDSQFGFQMFMRDENDEFTIDITDNTYLTPGMAFDSSPPGDGYVRGGAKWNCISIFFVSQSFFARSHQDCVPTGRVLS